MNQKYRHGDHVMARDKSGMVTVFTESCKDGVVRGTYVDREAIVIGSYLDQYGGEDRDPSYTLYIKGRGEVSWYREDQLSLIQAERPDLLEEWKADMDKDAAEKSNLDWIFSHGEEVLAHPHGKTVEALARHFGVDNLWGSNGEGFVYMANARAVLQVSAVFLQNGDKEGFLSFADSVKEENE